MGLLFAFMPVLSTAAGGTADFDLPLLLSVMGRVAAKLGVLALGALLVARTVLPPAWRVLARRFGAEPFQLASIAFCLLCALGTARQGISAELGAFVAGVMLSATEQAEAVAHHLGAPACCLGLCRAVVRRVLAGRAAAAEHGCSAAQPAPPAVAPRAQPTLAPRHPQSRREVPALPLAARPRDASAANHPTQTLLCHTPILAARRARLPALPPPPRLLPTGPHQSGPEQLRPRPPVRPQSPSPSSSSPSSSPPPAWC